VSPHALHRHRDELRSRNCVDIDAGLPSESRESLKILHYLLDNARVAFVAISNRPLGTALRIGCVCGRGCGCDTPARCRADAAKMNRLVEVFRPKASMSELNVLLAGSLSIPLAAAEQPTITAFSKAYSDLMQSREPLVPGGIRFCERFGLRDFYALGRFFKRAHRGGLPLVTDVLRALERNFNGVTPEEFEVIVAAFCQQLSQIMPDIYVHSRKRRSTVSILRDAMKDTVDNAAQLNETIVRYKLVLDESDTDEAARLLYLGGVLSM
jgi:hypothetical protein